MQNKKPHRFHAHRRVVRAPLIAGLVLLGGCGSGHSASPSTTRSTTSTSLCPGGEPACVSRSQRAKASGSQALDANLIRSMARTSPTLRQIKLDCPQPAGYPIHCRLTASDKARGKPHKVAGTVKVLGVDTKTQTYDYVLDYAPSGG